MCIYLSLLYDKLIYNKFFKEDIIIMYLIYCTTDGSIFREVDNVRRNGTSLEAGINGTYTLIYPENVHAEYMEVTKEQVEGLGDDYSKYMVKDGQIVENPDWVPHVDEHEMMDENIIEGEATVIE